MNTMLLYIASYVNVEVFFLTDSGDFFFTVLFPAPTDAHS
jgi:hypothetical protein